MNIHKRRRLERAAAAQAPVVEEVVEAKAPTKKSKAKTKKAEAADEALEAEAVAEETAEAPVEE
jgi:hypothetical protein